MADAKPVHSAKPEPEKKDPKAPIPAGKAGYSATLPSGATRKDN